MSVQTGPGRFVLFGHPVGHSWSPFIHGMFARQFDHVVDYKLRDVPAARAHAITQGRGLAVVASVVGTAGDPQGLAGQVARLETAGTWVLPSNAQAARAAACIAGGPAVLAACLGSGQR